MKGNENRDGSKIRRHRLLTCHPLGATFVISILFFISPSISPLAAAPPAEEAVLVWIGPEGEPLPFRTNEEIEDFLRTAEVLEMEDISIGVNHPRRVLLEKNGIQAKACFRDVDIYERQAVLSKRGVRKHWRDCCMFECAAYELGKLLGLNNIPPAVMREIKGTEVTVQIWLEGALMEKDRAIRNINLPIRGAT